MTGEKMHECRQEHKGGRKRKGHGPSSAWMHDPKMVLDLINMETGHVFADLGCGEGDYTIEASKIVGQAGKVYAVDKWPYLIKNLTNAIEPMGLDNIIPVTADIADSLPMDDGSVDVVFMATVLHIFNLKKYGEAIFREVARILKPGGLLAVVECKKEEQPFGPPKHMRNSPEDIEEIVAPHGFERIRYNDLGYNYLIQFTRRP